MGLHVQSLDIIPKDEYREYYLYLLDYGWREPIRDSLFDNFGKMADRASRAEAVIVRGTDQHFEDEVLSYHQINGEHAGNLLPAILVTRTHPNDFRERKLSRPFTGKGDPFAFILVPVNDICRTPADVAKLVMEIFEDIEAKKDLSKFQIKKEVRHGIGRAIVDSIILEPNVYGLGFSFKKLVEFFRR